MPVPFQSHLEGKYEILERLGGGGMGALYKVRHRLLDEIRVVKILLPQLAAAEEFRARFLREARLAIRLRHPNIAQLYDFTLDEDGTAFLIMEFINGKTLEEILQGGPLSLGLTLEIAEQALDALAYLHGQGFVHRDISPDNLMLSVGPEGKPMVKLIDLGIAKNLREEETGVTRSGTFLGKVRYASPESFGAEGTVVNDARSDLYSFGVVLYELLTGVHPIPGRDPSSLIAGHLFRPPIPFSESDPDGRVPLGLRTAVLKALGKKPEERYASAQELARELARFRPALESSAAEFADRLQAADSFAVVQFTGHGEAEMAKTPTKVVVQEGTQVLALSPPPRAESSVRPGYCLESKDGVGEEVPEEPPWKELSLTVINPARSAGPLPQTLRRFTLHELIARGRSGSLYKAYDPVRGGLCGLKVVPIADETALDRLIRGGRIWLNLSHPHLLKVLEIQPPEGEVPAVIVTELVEGTDLASLISNRSLTLEAKLEIASQLAEALAYLHEQGVLHREVKPSNVLVARGPHALLLDSGIARPSNPDLESLTRTGVIVGDLRYMAPEQLQGKAEVRSDIFSLGALTYELLMGEQPRLDQRTELFERLDRDTSLPQRLAQIIKKCLAENPLERYATARDLTASLRGLMAGGTPRARAQRQVVALHGIRTYAGWQRTLAEVATEASWQCRSDRWNFGYFSVIRFLQPWARSAKVEWFRHTYREEFNLAADSGPELPSIVAHSFGTYILGNALLRYPYLRFNRVILCGSILPIDFPWATLLDSGQIQTVRNEYGARDFWTGLVK
ncbi:MAG TPA: serine/threonine-protein kinase, partial [Thermoanaerobaculia bacterium]|nr:serine/threonine-protein kinase [Thermoanaerobaculia bacterium]